jgi:hypothetical protein
MLPVFGGSGLRDADTAVFLPAVTVTVLLHAE